MQVERIRSARLGLNIVIAILVLVMVPLSAAAAPYAAHVIDARTGEVLHSRNADTRLHPASLTKMMTLYVAFEAIRNGEISLDTKVRISKNAAAEPPSKLGLRAGQRIALRYLIRAAAVKSANDAATAIGEAISGSEKAFTRRMTATARRMGMSKTTFKNAHGLTTKGHLSTARDMTALGRHLLYDYPQYYNLFSRRSTNAGVKTVNNTNRRLLAAYRGADGIKTGYTRAAGFNLVASAERGRERIIATVFGGTSTAARNAKVAELLDLGFRRAPSRAPLRKPSRPAYLGKSGGGFAELQDEPARAPNRVIAAVKTSPRPKARPGATVIAEVDGTADAAVTAAVLAAVQVTKPETETPAETKADPGEALSESVTAAVAQAVPTPTAKPELAAIRPKARIPGSDTVATEIARQVASVDTATDLPEKPATDAAEKSAAIQPKAPPKPSTSAPVRTVIRPAARPAELVLAALPADAQVQPTAKTPAPQKAPDPAPEVVTRLSTSGGQHWGISVGRYSTRFEAEKVLLRTALAEMATLDGSLRKVVKSSRGFEANFMGMTRDTADLACRRLQARNVSCLTIGPS